MLEGRGEVGFGGGIIAGKSVPPLYETLLIFQKQQILTMYSMFAMGVSHGSLY